MFAGVVESMAQGGQLYTHTAKNVEMADVLWEAGGYGMIQTTIEAVEQQVTHPS